MFNTREEQLKDFKKLIRLTKKIVPLAIERNLAEREFTSGLEEYLKLQDDIDLLEQVRLNSLIGKEKLEQDIKVLEKSLRDLERKNPITKEKRKARKRSIYLSCEIERYKEYIKSKAHEFYGFKLSSEEYEFCECDDLLIFIIILIFKEVHKEMEDLDNPELIIFDTSLFDFQFHTNGGVVSFRRRIFLTENPVRTALTKILNEKSKRPYSTKIWEKEDDLLHLPIFSDLDFETFIKYLD